MDENSATSLEEALLTMYDGKKGIQNFESCPKLKNCLKTSQKRALDRILCIEALHSVRNLVVKQSYIGLVGLQNAGRLIAKNNRRTIFAIIYVLYAYTFQANPLY